MGLLADAFRQKVSKMKDPRMSTEAEFEIFYPTGFLPFDFMNGCKIHTMVNGENKEYYAVGIQDGSINIVVGRSGCGKSTWVQQVAGNIVRPFPQSTVFFDSNEGGVTIDRLETLTGFHGEELKQRYIIRNTGITIENIYERVKLIHDIKLEQKDELTYDTGLYDTRGNRIFKLQPTVYVIDSLALLMPDQLTDEEQLSGQMSATASAKANAALFKRLVPLTKMANIIIFVINHINKKVEINPFAKSRAQLSYFKQDETTPGGNTPNYVANNLIRLEDTTKLKQDKDLGINGSIVEVSLIKSRVTELNQSVPLVFQFSRGFVSELSLFLMLKNIGKIKGAGAYFYIEGHEKSKFSQKNFLNELMTNDEIKRAFIEESMKMLTSTLDAQDQVKHTASGNYHIENDILNQINSSL